MQIIDSGHTFRKLFQDRSEGREVLWLKYEDYYDSPKNRILDIAHFAGISLSASDVSTILEETSIQKNYERGTSAQKKADGFSDWDIGGMQSFHVSPVTMGRPGAWIEKFRETYDMIVNSDSEACEVLCRLTTQMGYDI